MKLEDDDASEEKKEELDKKKRGIDSGILQVNTYM